MRKLLAFWAISRRKTRLCKEKTWIVLKVNDETNAGLENSFGRKSDFEKN